MNAFVKKEIRLLLPSFLIGIALTFSNLFLRQGNDLLSGMLYLIPFAVCPALAVMIALDSFGCEVSSGTFAMLLAQPVSRLKIWQTKISLLAISLLVLVLFWCGLFCYHDAYFNEYRATDLNDFFVAAAIFALVVFSGGLWTVLLLRQVAAAFWFTLLVPGALLIILEGLFADYSGAFQKGMIVSVLGLYSLAGFFFARWLFLRAQDMQWSGGTIAMPEMRGLPAWFSKSGMKRIYHPLRALLRKEFQLHQAQFIMAFALLIFHLVVLAMRRFYDLKHSPDLKYILDIFWGLWLIMPLLVGCAAVAEERKLGTLEGQLCLPVKRRMQFATKLVVALFLSVFLGAVMPLLVEGTRILPNVHFNFNGLAAGIWKQIDASHALSAWQILYWNCLSAFNVLLPLLTLAGIAAAFGSISFYISSLMRNTLQTLAPALLGILLGFFMLTTISQMRDLDLDFLWHGPLPYFIVLPVMLLTLLMLAFWNFQYIRTGWRMWRRNFFVFLLALMFAMTATTAVYHRVWEKLTPFEPPHGVARLSLSNPASLNTQWSGVSVRLPDGKIWISYYMADLNNLNPISRLLGNIKITMSDGQFISGSNWLTVQNSYRELIGLKTNGSLWVSEGPEQKGSFLNGKWTINQEKMLQLVPFGNETNWNSFVSIGLSVLLVKNDGTLWRWGVTTNFDFKHNQWPGLRTFTPYRLGTESNWAKIYETFNQMLLRKTDGSVWTRSDNDRNTNRETLLEIEPGFTLQSVQNLGRDKFRSVARVEHGLQSDVGVRDDGTFRIWADERFGLVKGQRNRDYEWYPVDLQIGDNTNWIAVAGRGDKIVTLKSDGSLWLWNFNFPFRDAWNRNNDDDYERKIQNTRPVRLGTHTDWIAISGDRGNVMALAADGSLWFWPLERSDYYNDYDNGNDPHLEPLLDISHKPQLLGNILGNAD